MLNTSEERHDELEKQYYFKCQDSKETVIIIFFEGTYPENMSSTHFSITYEPEKIRLKNEYTNGIFGTNTRPIYIK